MSITLLQLRTAARQRADMENSDFVSNSELTGYINSAIAELHDVLIGCYGADYFVTSASVSTTANQDYVNLSSVSSSFYKLKGVDVLLNGTYYNLKPFNWNERNRNADLGWGLVSGPNIRYRVVGSKLQLSPTPESVYTLKVWYIPVATKLSADGDTLDDQNQYFEFVVLDAAIKMMAKEESDVSVLAAQKEQVRQRIITSAGRDAEKADSISDIYAENDDYWWP